ncbi:MAG: TonB family protein [Nitrospirales bacterium]|nr:TonB family protein [Nitrospirales bacterium]
MSYGSHLSLFIHPASEQANGEHGHLRLMLGSSCLLHVLLIGLALLTSLSSRVNQFPGAYQVSLLSFSDFQDSPAIGNSEKQPMPTHAQASAPPVQAKAQTQITSQTNPIKASPPLANSFVDALKNVVVPTPRTVELKEPNHNAHAFNTPGPEITASQSATTAIIPPPHVPNMAAPSSQPFQKPMKTSPTASPIQEAIAKTVQSVVVPEPRSVPAMPRISPYPVSEETQDMKPSTEPSLHIKAPQLASIQPLKVPTSQEHILQDNHRLTQSVTQSIKAVVIPQQQARISSPASPQPQESRPDTMINPAEETSLQQSPPGESLTSGLKQAVQSIVIPPPVTDLPKTIKTPMVLPTPPPPPLAKTPDSNHLPSQSHIESQQLQEDIERSRREIADLPIPSPLVRTESAAVPLQQEPRINERMVTDLHMPEGTPEGNPYWGRVQAIIVQHWVAPPVEMGHDRLLQAIIAFRIDRLGQVSHIEIQQPSGNVYYDVAAKRAVLRANPLPPFPSDMPDAYHDLQFQFSIIKE